MILFLVEEDPNARSRDFFFLIKKMPYNIKLKLIEILKYFFKHSVQFKSQFVRLYTEGNNAHLVETEIQLFKFKQYLQYQLKQTVQGPSINDATQKLPTK